MSCVGVLYIYYVDSCNVSIMITIYHLLCLLLELFMSSMPTDMPSYRVKRNNVLLLMNIALREMTPICHKFVKHFTDAVLCFMYALFLKSGNDSHL